MSKSCSLLSMHLQIKPDGQVKPCCRFDVSTDSRFEGIQAKDIPHLLRSDLWQELRARLDGGDMIPGCKRCWHEESAGKLSMRQAHAGSDRNPPTLEFLEIAFGNYCNLKCRTCDSLTSSSWYEDDVFLSSVRDRPVSTPRINLDFHWTSEDIAAVDRVKFTGGEPMLHPHFKRFLDLFDDDHAARTRLVVYTNCSWSPKPQLVAALSRFGKVRICLSIDGIGAVNDYIRHPARWSDTERAARDWLQLEKAGKLQVWWCPTICLYNIRQLADMTEWWLAAREEADLDLVSGETIFATISILSDPAYLSISLLPDAAQRGVIQSLSFEKRSDLSEYLHRNVVRHVTAMLKAPAETTLDDFFDFTQRLDERRGESFADAFPQLAKDLGWPSA